MKSNGDMLFQKIGYEKINDNKYKMRDWWNPNFYVYIKLDEENQSFIKYIKNTAKQRSLAEWISKDEINAIAVKLEELRA